MQAPAQQEGKPIANMKAVQVIKSPFCRRILATVFVLAVLLMVVFGLLAFSPDDRFRVPKKEDWEKLKESVKGGFPWAMDDTYVQQPTCSSVNNTGSLDVWHAAQEKYKHYREDKFTVIIQTYNRMDELKKTVDVLCSPDIPSLHEIVIVWNNVEVDPPENYVCKHKIPVRYRKSEINSLNQKLLPDPAYETKAVLLSDDDVYYHPKDLEFVFQTWRKFSQYRLTGALPRCAVQDEKGHWQYTFCVDGKEKDSYALIITNLCFAHIGFLDYYSSQDKVMTKLRKYVDDHMNCEDIGTNFVASLLTGTGPLLVKGWEDYVNYNPKGGISTKPGHIEARGKCIDDFSKMLGCMPLRNETARIERGALQL